MSKGDQSAKSPSDWLNNYRRMKNEKEHNKKLNEIRKNVKIGKLIEEKKWQQNIDSAKKVKLTSKQAFMAKVVLDAHENIGIEKVASQFNVTAVDLEKSFVILDELQKNGWSFTLKNSNFPILYFEHDEDVVTDNDKGEDIGDRDSIADFIDEETTDEEYLELDRKNEQFWAAEFFEPEENKSEDNALHKPCNKITYRRVRRVIIPAVGMLKSISIPNDLSDEEHEIFIELLDTIKELESRVLLVSAANEDIKNNHKILKEKIGEMLPLWKRAWENFILNFAGGAGSAAGRTSIFMAGFIAGSLYSSFSNSSLGLDI